jgi:hypothetical protein
MDDKFSRRAMLQRGAAFGVLAAFSAAACGKERHALSCADTSGLAPEELALRTSPAVAYADGAVDPGKPCDRCQHFIPAAVPNACGTCKVVKGPINPKGGCKLFVAKPA